MIVLNITPIVILAIFVHLCLCVHEFFVYVITVKERYVIIGSYFISDFFIQINFFLFIGLTNNMLEHQKAFNKESFSLINSFLELHQKPICLVAHNGNYFDYPILRAEIHNTDSSLSDDILCVDSIQVFKQLHNEELYKAMNIKKENSIKQENTIKQENYKTNTPTLQIRKNRKNKSSKSVEKEEINLTELYYIPGVNYEKKSSTNTVASELNDGFDELLSQVLDNTEEILSKKSFEEVQRLNMMTPTKKSKDSEVASDIANKGRSVKNVNKNFSNVSFKLSDVYRRIAKKEPILAHNAECDVNMLLECAAILGEDFVDWANENARKFNEIPMMKPIN